MVARSAILTATRMTSTMKSIFHNTPISLFQIVLFSVIFYSLSFSQASHTVTVVVQPVSLIQVNVGTINLNMTGANAIAGQDQMSVSDQSCTLLWGTNSSLQKISISTNLATPLFTIKVEALSPSTGNANPEFTLSSIAQDLILDIGRSSGSSNIRYTGVALASQGTGTDSHVITFTIQAQ